MADALLGVVIDKSISLVQNEFATLSGLKEKADKLSNTLTVIKAVLDDAEERQMTDIPVKIWLQELRDVAHVLEDILEDCSSESQQLGGLSSLNPKNIMFSYRIGNKLKEMMEKLDQIVKDKNNFGLREGVRERPSEEVAEWRQTSSTIARPQVYGRDEDKEKVLQFLLSPARCSDSLSVYPIVGLGGLGKTTLAQLVYNDHRVSNHFNLKIWICVSENFTVKEILCSIIESVTKAKCDIMALDVIEQKVQELLQSKLYLLVLDDVWKRNQQLKLGLSQEKWDKLRSVLSCGSKGASILVSTRDMDVAEIMGTCKAHHLTVLSDDECWLLFKEKAFGHDKEGPAKLVKIGKEIVKRCGGLPLAAQVLGGLMRSSSEEKQWLKVKESKLWTLSDDENGILPTLRLSYFYLKPTLKQCFAFCAIFPKDARMVKQDLIHLWMANGFFSGQNNLEVEDVGNKIWNELCQKSFFQDVNMNDFGDICFKMHDLVHDLAQSIRKQECLYLDKTNTNSLSRNTHHIAVDSGAALNKQAFEKVESLRTLYQLKTHGEEISGWFPTNRSLRVLRTDSLKLLSLLENFTHLRYLELHSMTEISSLPDSICNLHNLEILKLINLFRLLCLPKNLTLLKNLRHIFICNCNSLSRMCPNIQNLFQLRTLSLYIVNIEIGHSLAELHGLNLGGELTIKGLKNVGRLFEAQKANLKGKEDLRTLNLVWSGESKSHDTDAGQVLEELQPHSNLEKLEISDYEGIQWPSWMGNKSVLINLVSLCLRNCRNCQELPQLGKLPSLRELTIRNSSKHVQFMDDYECYDGVEVMAFPSLKKLTLVDLPNLERLLKWERGAMFPHLYWLHVGNCPKLQLSFLPCVKTLTVRGCSYELLRSISCLNSLRDFTLFDDEEVESLPEGTLNKLTCLQSLKISGLKNLKELADRDLEGLCSLRKLEIDSCGGLRCLPDGVRHLPTLQHLTIRNCPELKKHIMKEQEKTGTR